MINIHGLGFRFSLILVAAAMLVVLTTAEFFYRATYEHEISEANNDIQELYQTVAATASIAAFLEDEDLAKEFQNPEFAQEYLLDLVQDEDEPMSVEEALRFTIPKIGVSEFSHMIGKSKTDVDKFLKGDRNLKPETLDEYLSPFNLRIRINLEKVA